MRFQIFSSIFLILFSFSIVNGQIYMMGVAPLEPGNLWKYIDIGWLGGQSNFFVTDSIVLIGKNNYKIVEVYKDGSITRHKRYLGTSPDNYYVKYDTLASDSNYKYFKKDCNIGDSWTQQYYIDLYEYSIIDTLTINAWGKSFFSKVVKITDYSLVEVYQVWADSIGLMEENSIGQYHMILGGCVINGVLYGDTTTTIVDDFEKSSNEFLLYQNYPNPFNPITIINYQIAERCVVSLKVYDLLGREIITLVDEEKPKGRYTVTFNGNGLSSGFYLCQMQSGNFIDTKKLLLLK